MGENGQLVKELNRIQLDRAKPMRQRGFKPMFDTTKIKPLNLWYRLLNLLCVNWAGRLERWWRNSKLLFFATSVVKSSRVKSSLVKPSQAAWLKPKQNKSNLTGPNKLQFNREKVTITTTVTTITSIKSKRFGFTDSSISCYLLTVCSGDDTIGASFRVASTCERRKSKWPSLNILFSS